MKIKNQRELIAGLCMFLFAGICCGETTADKSGACAIVAFTELDTRTYKSNLRSAQDLRGIVKTCDEAIKAMPGNGYKYYNRGLARYYLIRGEDQPFAKTASQAASIDPADLQIGQADMQKFLMANDSTNWPDERKWAYLASGELYALLAFREKKPELFQAALKQLDAGQKSDTRQIDKETFDKRYIEARAVIETVLRSNAGNPMSPSAGNDVRARYQKYMSDYGAAEATYKNAVLAFQETQKSQHASALPNQALICKQVGEMNSSYGLLKTVFANIVEMKNKGELNADAALVQRIEAREAQQKTVQGQIDNTAAGFHCASPSAAAVLDTSGGVADDDKILFAAVFDIGDGKYQQAVDDLTAYIKGHPLEGVAFAERSRAYLLLHKDDLALVDAEKALSLSPKNYAAINVRGIVRNSRKDYTAAIADFTSAISVQPDEVKAYLNRAQVYIQLEKFVDALKDYSSVIRIDPKFPNIHAMRGNVNLQMKSWAEALGDFRLAAAAKPDDQQTNDKIAMILKDHPQP